MVKKMSQQPKTQNTYLSAQTQIRPGNLENNLLTGQENNLQQSRSQQLDLNVVNSNPNISESNLNDMNSCSNHYNNVPKPSYRITSYPIQNKTYRLISLSDQDSQDEDPLNQPVNLPHFNNQEQQFRQPALIPPRFNPFARWNNHNNRDPQRRRFNRRYARNKKSTLQQIVSTVRKLYMYLKTARLSSICQYIPFYLHSPTLYSKYSNISLAILNNSMNLQSAIIKALEYNIPLMQIIMNPKNSGEEKIVVEKILKDFTIAHFVNQNFVLYGDWACYEGYKEVFRKNFNDMQAISQEGNINANQRIFDQGGKIVFRKGEIVFAEIDLSYVGMIDHNQLQQKLQQIRNHYYRHKQLYRNPISAISSVISQPGSSQQSSGQSNGPVQPKTVQQIQEQILKDYLEQKLQEDIAGHQRMYGNEEDSDDQEYEGQEIVYGEDGSSFLKSQLEQRNLSKFIKEKQQQKVEQNDYHNDEGNEINDMIQSRKKLTYQKPQPKNK